MKLSDKDIKNLLDFIKKEPRTVQEVANYTKISWVTAEKYLQQLREKTGLINLKTYREGTKGALKLAYYENKSVAIEDQIKNNLFTQIMYGKKKQDFDFMEIFQFIEDTKKKSFLESDYKKNGYFSGISKLNQAARTIYFFSGNMSFLGLAKGNKSVINLIEDALKKNISIKILCRINIASLSNIAKISHLMVKYPQLIEVRHRYQPLRGYILDDRVARFKNEENIADYKKGELIKDQLLIYEVYDPVWISWLQKIFWNMYHTSITYEGRVKEIQKLL